MNFDGFLQDCNAQWPGFENPQTRITIGGPIDRRFETILKTVPAMATENKLALLNRAVARLQSDEVYVEIGCWHGATLIAAALGNPDKTAYGCDNFSQFEGAESVLRCNLDRFGVSDKVQFFNMDFREFITLAPWRPARVGAYFYDGGHRFREQFDALDLIVPHLANDAIVIIDDTNSVEVRAANQYFANRVREMELIIDIFTPPGSLSSWWNGIQVFRYRRLGGEASKNGYRSAIKRVVDRVEVQGLKAFYDWRRVVSTLPGARPAYRMLRALKSI